MSPASSQKQDPTKAEPQAELASSAGAGSGRWTAGPAATNDRAVRRLMVLAVAAVLSLAAAALTAVGAWTASSSGPQANRAFVDERATGELVGQVTNAITIIYSYDYHNLGATEDAAKDVITGAFAEEFGQVFGPVKRFAPAQQAILRTSVPAAGVKLLRGDHAQLLMMVNQSGTRGPDQEPTGAAARLVVEAQKVDGRWKIAGVGSE